MIVQETKSTVFYRADRDCNAVCLSVVKKRGSLAENSFNNHCFLITCFLRNYLSIIWQCLSCFDNRLIYSWVNLVFAIWTHLMIILHFAIMKDSWITTSLINWLDNWEAWGFPMIICLWTRESGFNYFSS